MIVTAKDLRTAGACERVVARLEREWPNGAEITVAVCLRAQSLGADLNWAAYKLFGPKAQHSYQTAVAAAVGRRNAAFDAAEREYRQDAAVARENYERSRPDGLYILQDTIGTLGARMRFAKDDAGLDFRIEWASAFVNASQCEEE